MFLLTEVIFVFVVWRFLKLVQAFDTRSHSEKLVFQEPKYAWLFFLIPLVVLALLYQAYKRNYRVNKYGSNKTISSFLKPVSTKRMYWRYFFLRNIIMFGVFALMQPAIGTKSVSAKASDLEMIFVVDISNSMNARDIVTGDTRLTVAKRAMNQLVNQTSASRVGIIIFAGSAYPQLPLTSDLGAAKMHIDELSTNLISNQGTHISSALLQASDFFSKERNRKVMVLITDGEDHEGGLAEAYSSMKEKNIQSYILGIGTEEGGIVPVGESPNAVSMKDDEGRPVISKINRSMLKEISKELSAETMVTNEGFPNLSQFLTQINRSSETNIVDLEFKVKKNRYQWPLVLSLLFVFTFFVWEEWLIRNS